MVTLPAIIQRYIDAYNRKDVPALVDCVADTVVFENISNTNQSIRIDGREAFAKLASHAAMMFESRTQTVRTAVVSGQNVALEIDWTATPALDIGPMKAGVEVSLRGASFITVTDGKLARIVDLS